MILFVFLALIVLFVVLPLVGLVLWQVLTAALVGLIFGALGRLVVPGRNPIGFLPTVICGWLGSLVGLAIGRAIGHHHGLVTLLLEIAGSAAAVAIWSGTHRRSIGGPRQAIGRR